MIVNILFLVLWALYLSPSLSCKKLRIESEEIGAYDFELASVVSSTQSGRSNFVSKDVESGRIVYLYHINTDRKSGVGRWVINDKLGSDEAGIAYVDSWAVSPHLINALHDSGKREWSIGRDGDWITDYSFSIYCEDQKDNTIYFETLTYQKSLNGFYVEAAPPLNSNYSDPLYSLVKEYDDQVNQYIYKYEGRWMIGSEIGSDLCHAFSRDPSTIVQDFETSEWFFVDGEEWVPDFGRIIFQTDETEDAYDALHFTRSIEFIPVNQSYIPLRHNVPLPSVGLGTGGLDPSSAKETITKALMIGYRTLDLAREYGNEEIVSNIFSEFAEIEGFPNREEVFLITKVWPTDLGFVPTSDAVSASLEALSTPYIDLVLLHWPSCIATVEWMHCEDVVDPEGTWQESWRALEKAFAEGRVQSIGVSNFNVELLEELADMASVMPHLVQNHGELGRTDEAVRHWCHEHHVIYMPYATIRNLKSSTVAHALESLSKAKGVSQQVISLKFFLQTNAAVIPRSTSPDHLLENLQLGAIANWTLNSKEMALLEWPEKLMHHIRTHVDEEETPTN